MRQYDCPNCGAPVIFLSAVSVQTTCTYCRSMVVRHDMNLETIGQVAELLDDMSPFQVGTTGKHKDKSFTLVGRIKVVYDKGTWSEWYALFDDGRDGWLAEAQGNYMMTFEEKDLEVQLHRLYPMTEMNLKGQRFVIEDVRKVTYFSSEGELPFEFQPKEKAMSIDLRSDDNVFATVSVSDHGQQVFMGEYAPFESFQFQNLRTLDGW